MAYNVYSLPDCKSLLYHPDVGTANLHQCGMGKIVVSAAGDLTSHTTTADGYIVVNKLKTTNGTITLEVPQNSIGDDFLRRWARSVLDLITSLSGDELRSIMTSCLNHVSVLLPAGPNPVMTGSELGYPELKHDMVSCMKLVLEEIALVLEGFFGEGGGHAPPTDATTSNY